MELHPHFQQPELFEFVREQGDRCPIGFAPIGSPARPERDRTPDDSGRHRGSRDRGRSRGAWASTRRSYASSGPIQRGQVPIPFSTTPAQLLAANLAGAIGEPLTEAEMTAIAGIDHNCRLIKGHVFLWKAGQSWEDLWDLDGTITPP